MVCLFKTQNYFLLLSEFRCYTYTKDDLNILHSQPDYQTNRIKVIMLHTVAYDCGETMQYHHDHYYHNHRCDIVNLRIAQWAMPTSGLATWWAILRWALGNISHQDCPPQWAILSNSVH